ncbi:MAG: hypothetical protein Q4G11_01315 [Gallicola sp.]|nr:hypothetical protein [Gallicola sp.]
MKKILTLFIAVVLVLLTACGGQGEEKKAEPEENKPEVSEEVKKETPEAEETPAVEQTPGSEENSELTGKWIVIASQVGEDVYTSERTEEESLTIELNADKTAIMNMAGTEPQKGTWEEKNENTALITVGEQSIEYVLEEGMLVGKTQELTTYFYKEGTEPTEKENALREAGKKTMEKEGGMEQ